MVDLHGKTKFKNMSYTKVKWFLLLSIGGGLWIFINIYFVLKFVFNSRST